MSNWSTHQFTRKGEQLRAKVEAGKCKFTLTKIKIGNGNVTLGEVKGMNDLKSPQLVLGISSCDVSAEDDRICEVIGIASSSNVENSFSVTEMGLFANDPDVGEILYLVGLDTAPDDMPNKNASSPVTLTYQFELVTRNMANVVAMISPAGLVTVKMLNTHLTAAELDHPDKSVRRKHLADNIYTLPAPEPADNTRFLRNDGTYQTITPNNIGAYHKSESYNKGEVDGRVNAKVSKSGDTMTGALTVPTVYSKDYIHCTGDGGILWDKYGGGFFMNESTTININNNKNLYTGGFIKAEKGFKGNLEGKATAAGRADSSVVSDRTVRVENDYRNMRFHWNGQGGQPTWLWGGNNGEDMFVYNPSNFSVDNANKLQNWTLQNILDEFLNVWHSNKAYTVGDIAYHKNLPSWARLECVVGGTTGNNANVFSKNVKAGQYIQDGGVQWIIDDVRDGNRVGSVAGSLYLPDGYIKANGATVQRADYPRLVALADKHNLWTNDTANNLGMFGRGNGSSTFVLPNWIDRMMQFAAQGGSTLAAGLPNITGQVGQGTDSMFNSAFCTGAFRGSAENSPAKNAAGGYRPIDSGYAVLDASKSNPIYGRSNTVQPAAIRLIPIIKY